MSFKIFSRNFRIQQSLYKQKQYLKVIEVGQDIRKFSAKNALFIETIMFAAYLKNKDYNGYTQLFEDMLKIPKSELAKNPNSFNFLINHAKKLKKLRKYIPEL